MRKTFDELVDDICGRDRYSEQYYSSEDVIQLLKLVRVQTIKECIELDKQLYYDNYQEYSVNGISKQDVLKLDINSISYEPTEYL